MSPSQRPQPTTHDPRPTTHDPRPTTQAYDKIYHWVQKRCGVTESEKGANNVAEAESIDDVDGSGVLKHAIHALRARPGFYVHCQESLGSHRRMLLVQRFVAALTVGGVGGTPRPIELQAHDPVRYVGDMVAWVHQAVASEKELLTSLFSAPKGAAPHSPPPTTTTTSSGLGADGGEGEGEGVGEDVGEGGDQVKTVGELLAHVTEGLARPLKVRLEGVLEAQLREGSGGMSLSMAMVHTYRLYNLMAFYYVVVKRIMLVPPTSAAVGEGAATAAATATAAAATLVTVLGECRATAASVFGSQMRQHSLNLTKAPPSFLGDLSTSPVTVEHLKRLTELLQVYTDSMVSEDDTAEFADTETGIETIMASLLEPLLQTCRLSAEGGGLDAADTATLMINNATSMRNAVEVFTTNATTKAWVGKLDAEVETWVGVLVKHEAGRMLSDCGMASLLETAEVMKLHGAASEQQGLEPETVERVMHAFYSSLFALVMPSFDRLTPPTARAAARKAIALQIVAAHDSVNAMVRDPANKYTNAEACLLHTPEQVRMLLDCD